jgi:small subunit ribosomal protein S16
VAVKIKLKRLGKIRAPYYRIIVADARTKRDGRAIEEIGKYHPKVEPSLIEVDSDRAQYWLSVGAQPTDPVRRLLEITGDWQRFKGLPGTEGTLKTAAPGPDKKQAFAAAVAETVKEAGKAAEGRPATGRSRRAPASDKGEKPDKAPAEGAGARDKPEKPARSAKTETARAGKPDTAKAGKAETARAGKPDTAKAEKPDTAKAEKPGKTEKPDKPAGGRPARSAAAKASAGTEGEPAGAEPAAGQGGEA